MKYLIGSTLKNARKNVGMSVEDVSRFLNENEITVATKTIYGWENNFSMPSINIFLLLCKCYGIKDILKSFGYEPLPKNRTVCFHEKDYSKEELDDIQKYADFLKGKRKS